MLALAAASCRTAPVRPPAPEPLVRVLVDLHEQVDLGRLDLAGGRRERGERVTAALAELAGRSQARLLPFLEEARRRGLVRSWQGFTIVNRLLVEATPKGIEALARHPEVAAVVPESEGPEPALMGEREEEKTSWAIGAVGAPAAWARGLDGTGVVVGVVDSGASDAHEQLAAGFRGGEASWLDPSGEHATPRDTRFGHGTGVLSVAVGRNAGGVTLGIAPGARWIACAALPRGRYNNVLATRCADWMLNVGRPDVIVASWVLPGSGCDRSLERIVEAWRAAGILPVFAAGNFGPGERTDRSPANYANVLSVGGLTREGGPLPETSRGPGACGSHAFPRISAPAEGLTAAFPLGRATYLTAKGTSFAAGIAGGAAAILIQSRPDALVPELEEAFGTGPLDIPEALQRLQSSGPSAPPSMADRTSGTGGPP